MKIPKTVFIIKYNNVVKKHIINVAQVKYFRAYQVFYNRERKGTTEMFPLPGHTITYSVKTRYSNLITFPLVSAYLVQKTTIPNHSL